MAKPTLTHDQVRREAIRVTTTVEILAEQCRNGLEAIFGTAVTIEDEETASE